MICLVAFVRSETDVRNIVGVRLVMGLGNVSDVV